MNKPTLQVRLHGDVGPNDCIVDCGHLAKFLRAQSDRIEHLEKICAAAYQLAGTVGAPVRFLDALALHDYVDPDTLLPVSIDECDGIQRTGENHG